MNFPIDLTPYLDLDRLDAIRPHILHGIANSRAQPIVISYTLNPKYSRAAAEEHLLTYPPNSIERELFNRSKAKGDDRDAAIYAQLLHGQYTGARLIPITQLRYGYPYDRIDDPEACEVGADFGKFDELITWIEGLPMERIGRITLFVNCVNVGTPIHRDGDYIPTHHKHEFVWVNITGKEFFIYDPRTRERHYTPRACFFDVKNWHGSEPGKTVSVSLRVDGLFTDELRTELGLSGLSSYLTPDIDYAAKVENDGREHED